MGEPGAGPRRGLLVDFGGVLTTSVFASFERFCRAEGIAPDEVFRRFGEDGEARDLLVALEEGRLDEDGFEPRFAALLGVDDHTELIARLMAEAGPEPTMVEGVRAARAAGVRTGLVSNSWGTRRYPRALLAELFDGWVISGEVGIRKPSRRIYELGADAIGLPPAACVFVDDLGFNLKAPAELGMATVRHADPATTLTELEELLGVRMPGVTP